VCVRRRKVSTDSRAPRKRGPIIKRGTPLTHCGAKTLLYCVSGNNWSKKAYTHMARKRKRNNIKWCDLARPASFDKTSAREVNRVQILQAPQTHTVVSANEPRSPLLIYLSRFLHGNALSRTQCALRAQERWIHYVVGGGLCVAAVM
jgi:hypothetical protein